MGEVLLIAYVTVAASLGVAHKDWRPIATFKVTGQKAGVEEAQAKCEKAAQELALQKFKCIKL